MAFPRLNALGMWITAAGLIVLLCAFLVPGGSPIAGWTSYPPLSASALAGPGEGAGQDLWLASIALFAIGGTDRRRRHAHHDREAPLRGHDLAPRPAHGLGMVHRRPARRPGLLRPARRPRSSLLRPPPRQRLLHSTRRRHQRHARLAPRLRLAAPLAPSLLVLRTP